MNFRLIFTLVFTLFLSTIIASCGAVNIGTPTPQTTPTPIQPTLPPTDVLPTATVVPVPVALAGPGLGAKMAWIDGSTLRYVPAATFQMGSGAPDAPVHPVSLDGFWIHETKVTNAMYSQCVEIGSCTAPAQEIGAPVSTNPDYANHPVVGVNWDQAQAYCTWTGGRLPTEAEWELAARGSSANLYPWGSDKPSCDRVNFGNCFAHTTDVTTYDQGGSPYGVLEMAGNVFEWVGDWYDENYYSASAGENPVGPDSGQYRVIRGSSFESEINQILASIRRFNETLDHSRDIGFRCAVPQPAALAPYCQLTPFIPPGQPTGPSVCVQPLPQVRGTYCVENYGYGTVRLPEGATFDVKEKEFDCTEAIVDGQRILTCRGPRAREVTGDISVCNPTCSESPDVTGATPICSPGYAYDQASNACTYAPILAQGGVTSCPLGYVLVDRGGQQTCAVGPGADDLCPQGLYLDSLYGACVPANGEAYTPYGIDDPSLAASNFQGCAPGYTYSEQTQCCQAASVTSYPGCAPGTLYNEELGACSPGAITITSEGCSTVALTVPACGKPVDVCKRIDSETHCIQASYACRWVEKEGICVLK